MKAHSEIQILLSATVLAALTGCATSPISAPLRKEARNVTLTQEAQNPGAYKGTVVIWGGRVIQTVNETNGAVIYVLGLPLDGRDKPDPHAASLGRFIARSRGFIDPEVCGRGCLVTVAGEIEGQQTEPLQKVQYAYPVVTIRELHIWIKVRHHYHGYYQPAPGWYYPGWYRGYGPGWGMGWGWYYPDWVWDEDYPVSVE